MAIIGIESTACRAQQGHTMPLPFPSRGDLDSLLNCLQVAVAGEELQLALKLMVELRGRLECDYGNTYERLSRRAGRWTDKDERLCDRAHRLYRALGAAGSSVVEGLIGWDSAGEPPIALAREITLEWFAEAKTWERIHHVTASKLWAHAA